METSPGRELTTCYLSTPQHARTFYGGYLYIYTDKGSVEFTGGHLRFHGRRTALDTPISSVIDLRLGSFKRAAKPTGLKRIELSYRADAEEGTRTIYLIPTSGAFSPTWTTNKVVKDWFDWLSDQRTTI